MFSSGSGFNAPDKVVPPIAIDGLKSKALLKEISFLSSLFSNLETSSYEIFEPLE